MIGYKIKDPATGLYAPEGLNSNIDYRVEDLGALFGSERIARSHISFWRNQTIERYQVNIEKLTWVDSLIIVKVERKDTEIGSS